MLRFFMTLFSQTRLIFTGSMSQGQSLAQFTLPAGSVLISAKTIEAQCEIAMLFGPALGTDGCTDPMADHRPTMLFFYGNGGYLAAAMVEFQFLRRMGANVLAIELPGYGLSGGNPSEAGCYDAADTALAYIQSRDDINPQLVIACGWSLGGAIAIDLASRTPLAGLATFSTFTGIADIAHKWFPLIPARAASLFLVAHFASERKIGAVRCPILIGLSRAAPDDSLRHVKAPKGRRNRTCNLCRVRQRPQRHIRLRCPGDRSSAPAVA